MTYKEVAELMKRADYNLAQNNGQMNQAYQDILRGMGGGGPYMSAPQQALNAGAMEGGIIPMLLGLGIGGLFAGGFGKIPSGQQLGRDAYQGFKQGIKQDLTDMGNAALGAAKDFGTKMGQAAIGTVPGANMVYQAGKAIYNNWDTVKNTAGQAWDATKNGIDKAWNKVTGQQQQLDVLNRSITPAQVQQARQKRLQSLNSPITQADVNAWRYARTQNLNSSLTQNDVQAQRARRGLPPSKKVQNNTQQR